MSHGFNSEVCTPVRLISKKNKPHYSGFVNRGLGFVVYGLDFRVDRRLTLKVKKLEPHTAAANSNIAFLRSVPNSHQTLRMFNP